MKSDREAIDTMSKDELERYIERVRAEVLGWCAAETGRDDLLDKVERDFD